MNTFWHEWQEMQYPGAAHKLKSNLGSIFARRDFTNTQSGAQCVKSFHCVRHSRLLGTGGVLVHQYCIREKLPTTEHSSGVMRWAKHMKHTHAQ